MARVRRTAESRRTVDESKWTRIGFALLVMAGPWVGRTLPAGTMMALVVLVSMPHYGATLLRVYEKREERQAYAFFAKYTTILLGLAFVWGLNNVGVGSLLF